MDYLHHVGVTVKDLDASIRFYHEVLGLRVTHEPTPWFDGDDLSKAIGVSGASLRIATVNAGSAQIEFLEYRRPQSTRKEPLASNNPGASHLAFIVEDIHAAKADLEAKGVEFFSPVNVVDEGVLAGWRWVYFSDPDGYPLELVQIAYTRPEERARGIAAYFASRTQGA